MNFGGIQKCSTIDFPGCLSCVLFVRGCGLNCFYCHNRPLLEPGGPVVPEAEVRVFLERRVGLLDGVVVSGGEPTLQEGLFALFEWLKKLGFQTKLDTNGQNPAMVKALLQAGLLDYVALDIKALQQDYSWVCAREAGYVAMRETLALLQGQQTAAAYEGRTTLYPGMDIEMLLRLLHSLPVLPRYRLNVYKPPVQSRAEDAFLLRRPAISAFALEDALPRIREAQPNIEW